LRVVPEPNDDAPFEPAADRQTDAPSVGVSGSTPMLVPEGVEPAGKASLTLAQFQNVWPSLFGGLRDLLGARRWALFRETEPGAAEGNVLVVAVRHDFHLRALRDDPAVAKIVATRAGDLLGAEVRVEFRPFGDSGQVDGATEDDLEDVELSPDRLVEAPPDTADPFKLVTEELGAQVVDEFEVEEGD
jgi:hypothetical protein